MRAENGEAKWFNAAQSDRKRRTAPGAATAARDVSAHVLARRHREMAARMAAQESRGDIADEKLASSRLDSVARRGFEPPDLFLERKSLQESDLELSRGPIVRIVQDVDALDGPNRASEKRPRLHAWTDYQVAPVMILDGPRGTRARACAPPRAPPSGSGRSSRRRELVQLQHGAPVARRAAGPDRLRLGEDGGREL